MSHEKQDRRCQQSWFQTEVASYLLNLPGHLFTSLRHSFLVYAMRKTSDLERLLGRLNTFALVMYLTLVRPKKSSSSPNLCYKSAPDRPDSTHFCSSLSVLTHPAQNPGVWPFLNPFHQISFQALPFISFLFFSCGHYGCDRYSYQFHAPTYLCWIDRIT